MVFKKLINNHHKQQHYYHTIKNRKIAIESARTHCFFFVVLKIKQKFYTHKAKLR
jgi:hypothetical protein